MTDVIRGRSAHPARKDPIIFISPGMFSGVLTVEIRSTLTKTGGMANAHIVLDEDGRRALIVQLGGTP